MAAASATVDLPQGDIGLLTPMSFVEPLIAQGGPVDMHTFKVVRETFGWAVRMGAGMTTPFWSQAAALREANALCASLRSHGVAAEVVVEEEVQGVEPGSVPRRDTARDAAGASHGRA